MLKTQLFNRFSRTLSLVRSQSNALNIEQLEKSTAEVEIDEDVKAKELEIEKKRNKSGLNSAHRLIVNAHEVPYKEPMHWSHATLKYQRKVFGKYGKQSNFDPSLCWTRQEIRDKKEYETVAYPYTVPQLIETAHAKTKEKEDEKMRIQADVVAKMAKNEHFQQELLKKMAKKEDDARLAQEQKNQLIEEVRRHFGYAVDPRDEKFKEMLEKKEKELRKASREARKKAREEQVVAKLLSKRASNDEKKTKDDKKDDD